VAVVFSLSALYMPCWDKLFVGISTNLQLSASVQTRVAAEVEVFRRQLLQFLVAMFVLTAGFEYQFWHLGLQDHLSLPSPGLATWASAVSLIGFVNAAIWVRPQ
jgi:hypothetical protein